MKQPTRRSVTAASIAFALLCTGCSNFNSRQRFWDQQLMGKLKAAPKDRLESFAAANGHELHCNGGSGQGSLPVSECYLVDANSKGALFNYGANCL